MKRAIYFTLLITGIVGLVLLGIHVPQGYARGSGDAPGDQIKGIEEEPTVEQEAGNVETLPEAWRGTWEVTVVYRDHETSRVVSTDVTTAAMCPGTSILPTLTIAALRCSVDAEDNGIGVWCTAKQKPFPGCNVFVNTVLDSKREGEIWSGVGSWTAEAVGVCANPAAKRLCPNCEPFNFGEDFMVSGVRISNDAACDGQGSSLVRSFFPHPNLIPILAERDSHDEK
jgi:hypothetical protein